jgi:wobble nucleotide-excising tRNase
MPNEFNLIEDLAIQIEREFNSTQDIISLYAFNSTGKTRLTTILSKDEDDGKITSLCYGAFFEDMFIWDNDLYFLKFNQCYEWIVDLIIVEGLEGEIVNNFKNMIKSKVEPYFDFEENYVTFNFASGDDDSEYNIKISKGEESMLIWSIFYTILKFAIDTLNTDEKDRTVSIFNDLKYIIIDDPISSIDDNVLINMTMDLVNTIASCKKNTVKFLITTHHALFYNVIYNTVTRDRKLNKRFKFFNLSKDTNNILKLKTQENDTPFSYHLLIKNIIQEAIDNDNIERYHFNLFRNLLEKTSNFLGYNKFDQVLPDIRRKEFAKIINLYSHSKVSDLESTGLPSEYKELFIDTFNDFVKRYNWNNKI